MLRFIFLLGFLSLCTALYQSFAGNDIITYQNKWLEINYSGQGYDNSHIINVKDYNITSRCEEDKLILEMDEDTKENILLQLNEIEPIFITNSDCLGPIYQVDKFEFDNNILFLKGYTTSLGSISDELDFKVNDYKGGKDYDKEFCFGLNVNDDDCSLAKNTINIYNWSNSDATGDISCPDCLVSFEGDTFLHFVIHRGRLIDIKGGIQNNILYLEAIFDIEANDDYNIKVTKDFPVLPSITLYDFSLFTIPVKFWMDIPSQLNANLEIYSEGDITLGWKSQWDFGDYYIEWEEENGWKLETGTPIKNNTAIFETNSDIEIDGEISISPNIRFHLNQIFETELLTTPKSYLKTSWNSVDKNICAEVSYQVDITALAEFNIDINWLGVHKKHEWGPVNVYDSGKLDLLNKCKQI